MEKEKVIKYLKSNGVASPENPSIDDMGKIYGLIYSNDTELNKEVFKEYAKTIKPSVDSVIGGINNFAKNLNVAKEYIDSIKDVIQMLKIDYEKADSEAKKDKIYEKIQNQLDRIKEESEEQRNLIKDLSRYSIGTALVIGGVGLAIATKKTDLLRKGIETIKINRK